MFIVPLSAAGTLLHFTVLRRLSGLERLGERESLPGRPDQDELGPVRNPSNCVRIRDEPALRLDCDHVESPALPDAGLRERLVDQ